MTATSISEPLNDIDFLPLTTAEAAGLPATRTATIAATKDDVALMHGASKLVLTDEEDAILGAEVPPEDVEIRPDGIVYLSHANLRRRLNDALGRGQWCMVPQGEPLLDTAEHTVSRVYHFFARGCFMCEAMGEQEYHPNSPTMSYADALEGASSNALSRAAKSLSVGLELWDKRWIEAWKDKHAVAVYVKKKNGEVKREWRRKDAKPFYNEQSGNGGTAGGGKPLAHNSVTATPSRPVVAPLPPNTSSASPAGSVAAEEIPTRTGKMVIEIHSHYDPQKHISKPKIGRAVVLAMLYARNQMKISDSHEQGVYAHTQLTRMAGEFGLEHYSLIPYQGDTYAQVCSALGGEK